MKTRGSAAKERETVLSFVDVSTEACARQRKRLDLSGREIHVWALSLDASPVAHRRFRTWLSSEEQDRAARFLSSQHRDEYVVAHGALRYLLGRYCGVDPGRLEFRSEEHGKPRLSTCGEKVEAVTFNLSHSHGRGLIAVSKGREVGIDLEMIHEAVKHLELAERFFAPTEFDEIRQRSPEQQREIFFRYWVCKEALLKGQGTGLRVSLKHCPILFLPGGDTARGVALDGDRPAREWFVRVLPIGNRWVGAVAAEGEDWTIRYGSWKGSV